eukprot:scaffold34550_cov56-Attheya_sp.AAC.2
MGFADPDDRGIVRVPTCLLDGWSGGRCKLLSVCWCLLGHVFGKNDWNGLDSMHRQWRLRRTYGGRTERYTF